MAARFGFNQIYAEISPPVGKGLDYIRRHQMRVYVTPPGAQGFGFKKSTLPMIDPRKEPIIKRP